MEGQKTVKDNLCEYRQFMVDADQKQQDSFDKTVLSLSGGALGVTFIFIKDIIGVDPIISPVLITIAWICWGISVCCTLFSFFTSHLLLIRTINRIDDAIKKGRPECFYTEKQGNSFQWLTNLLNISGASLFVVGVILTAIFASLNFGK